jgi:hypothetical protein
MVVYRYSKYQKRIQKGSLVSHPPRSHVLHATRASSAARLTLSHHPHIAKKTENIWDNYGRDNYGTIMGQLSQDFRHGHLHII